MAHANHHKNRRRKNALTNLARQQEAMHERGGEILKHRAENEGEPLIVEADNLALKQLEVKLVRNEAEQATLNSRIKKEA